MKPHDTFAAGDRRRLWLAALAVVLFYAAALGVLWRFIPGTLGNVDATVKIWQVESIRRGQLHLTYPAATLDEKSEFMPTTSVVIVDGKPYAMYLNLLTGLLLAGSWVFGRMAYHLVPMLLALATIALVAWFARRNRLLPERDLWLLVILLGFCSPLLVYSLSPLEHSLASAIAAGGFILVADGLQAGRTGRWKSLLVRFACAGACLALAPLARPECYALAAAIGGTAVVLLLVMRVPLRWCVASAAVMAASGVFVLTTVFLVFPLLFKVQMALNTQSRDVRLSMMMRFWHYLFLVEPGNTLSRILTHPVAVALGAAGSGLLVAAAVMGLISGVARSWQRHLATALFLGAAAAILVCWGIDGVFAAVPLLGLMFFLRGDLAYRNPVVGLVLISGVAFMALLGLLLPHTGGGILFSPRYLLPVTMPAIAVAFCMVRTHLARSPNRWLSVMLVIAAATSCVGVVKGVATDYGSAAIAEEMDRRLASMPEPYMNCVDSDLQFIYHAPKTALGSRVLRVSGEERFRKVVAEFRRRHIGTFTMIDLRDRIEENLGRIRRAGGIVVERRDIEYAGLAIVVKLADDADRPAAGPEE